MSPLTNPFPPSVTVIALISPPLTVTFAVIVSPTPVRAVNPTPVYVPFVNPIPETAIEDRFNAGPPKLDILPSSLIPPFA